MAKPGTAASGKADSAAGRSKRRALIEIAIAYGLILAVIWTPRPWQKFLWWAAVAAVVVITCISWDGLEAMGLRTADFFRSLWVVGVALAIAVAAALVAARFHTLRLPGSPLLFVKTYWAYAVWSGVQQFLLQCFFLARLVRVFPRPRQAAVAAAGLFALAHLPSPILASATIVWGIASCLIFLHYRNLYPLAIAHAIFGIAIAITIPGRVDHNMRVGWGYLIYGQEHDHDHSHHRSHSDQSASTVAWVTADAPTLRSRIQARP